MDDAAVEVGKTLEKEDARFHMHKGLFSTMFTTMKGLGLKVDGVLLDIGISSPQLDGDRGFRPEMEGPLDLRFDLNSGVPAYEYLQTVSAQELAEVLVRCGGEDAIAAQRIADMVVMQRQTGASSTLNPSCTTRAESETMSRVRRCERRGGCWVPWRSTHAPSGRVRCCTWQRENRLPWQKA
jgi:16S rRNA C1402 N4-methylase RsmH